MYATALEDHLLPDMQTMEEVFPVDDKEEWIGRSSICTISARMEF